jgi:hypothetical protein
VDSSNWKPWWKRISEFDTPHEKAEFMRGVAGAKPSGQMTNTSAILLGLVAGYVGGKAADSRKWL